MLDTAYDQGSTLRNGNVPGSEGATRLIAMVRHGDAATEARLLWQLCSALEDFGHPVVVLDAEALERNDNPGLAHAMESGGWHHHPAARSGAVAVLPAALGLERLLAQGREALQAEGPSARETLAEHFRLYGIVIVYADAPTVAALWSEGGGAPLLVATPAQPVVMSAYRSVKQLFIAAGLLPTVASISSAGAAQAQREAASVGTALQRCARDYLGCDVDVVTVAASADDASRAGDVHRLALRLLENASATAHAAATDTPARSL